MPIRVLRPPAKPFVLTAAGLLAVVSVLAAIVWWPRDDGDDVRLDAGSTLPTTGAPVSAGTAPTVAAPSTAPAPPTLPPAGTTPTDGGGEAASSGSTLVPGAAAVGAGQPSAPADRASPAGTSPSGGQGSGTTTAATSPTTSPPPASGSWQPGHRPFAASSSWNTPIPGGARFTDIPMPAASGGNYWVDWEEYSVAVWVAQPGDPLVAVNHPSGWGFPANSAKFHLRRGVTGASGSDATILVVDGTRVHNLWRFQRTGDNSATASAAASADTATDTGWGSPAGSGTGAGVTAVGSSQLAGLLMQSEVEAGEIRHALQLSVDTRLNRPGPVGEALQADGTASDGIVHQGQRLAIPPSVAMPAGLSPLGQKVFRALQTYGAFDVDSSGGSTTLRAQSNAFDAATIDALRKDMKALGPLLEAVDW